MTSALAFAILAQIAAATPAAMQSREPVLEFPEVGLDDTAAYRGYRTRFYRDAADNTLQVYLDRREARVVHLLADAENESVGFSALDAEGEPAPVRWAGREARVGRSGRSRFLQYNLAADAPVIRVGHFVLGSMRVERDFQAWRRHRAPFGGPPFLLDEHRRLLAALGRLGAPERGRHLALLHAADARTLRARLAPTLGTRRANGRWVLRVVQPTIDARDTLALELSADAGRVVATRAGDAVTFRSRDGTPVELTVRIETTGGALTPLSRGKIFTPEFLAFADQARRADGDSAAIRARWLERQVRGVELLVSREKLMAGLPTYATYFGRDMLMTALMMRPIWRPEMSEFAIGAALRKLGPTGQVSHEEALGGQAVREAAAEYAGLVDAHLAAAQRGDRTTADSLLAVARGVLAGARRPRENYHMIDDELQFAVLAGRWLDDARVPAERKRAFLRDSAEGGGGPRLVGLLRELALVARMTDAYAREAVAANLISFAPRDSGRWASTSWRDSNAGYAGGRYAMDVNAIWAPHAVESLGRVLAALRTLGMLDEATMAMPELAATAPLGRLARDSSALRAAASAWWDAGRHFLVQLGPAEVQEGVTARLAAMPPTERLHWLRVLATTRTERDSLTFLALALDADARPIGVVNSDVATGLFLGGPRATDSTGRAAVLRDVRTFARPYPVGLFVDRVGPVVANDAYAPARVWEQFVRDPYHGPRVVWGREVNLFLLGVANQVAAASDPSGAVPAADAAYVRELRETAARVQAAAEASGFQSELWSYDFVGGRPRPVRYGSGADVQLWSTTDLVVQYVLSRLPR